jgi:hypothetical protein
MDYSPWKVSGSYYEVCNCEAICPCRRWGGAPGKRPMYANCDFALSWWIQRGQAGPIDLGDRKVVMAGRWEAIQGDPWHVTLYVDDRATSEQHDALAALFLGKAGGHPAKSFGPNIVEVHAVRRATIELDHARAKEKIQVAPFLTVRTQEAVAHEHTVSCGIPGHDRPGQEIRAEVFRFADGPYDWELRGKCGFATDFEYVS